MTPKTDCCAHETVMKLLSGQLRCLVCGETLTEDDLPNPLDDYEEDL